MVAEVPSEVRDDRKCTGWIKMTLEFRKTCAAIELHELVLRLKAAMARWEEVMFARDDDAGFNKYLEIATASVQARNETKTVDEKVSEMGEGLDEVFARAFPKLYPEHPVNRPVA